MKLFSYLPLVVAVSAATLTSGCATNNLFEDLFADTPDEQVEPAYEISESIKSQGLVYRQERRDRERANTSNRSSGKGLWHTPDGLYHPEFTHKSLADYAEQLTMRLVENSRELASKSRVGVATFVYLDASLNRSSSLGNQLAEYFISEIQQYGISAVDFKLMDHIHVQRDGDFVFSRNARQLAASVDIDYILSGTLIPSEKGVRVNARVVSQQHKGVVSSASLLIPHFIVGELSPRYVMTD